MEPIFFYIFSFIIIASVVLMILQTNPVASAICLVAALFGLAGLYVLLQAHFVAVLQVLVYAGAIMVLFIFVIMLLNLKEDELVYDKPNLKRLIVAVMGLGLFGFLAAFFLKIPPVSFPQVAAEFGTVKEVGKLLFLKYMLPFEIIGLLLLVGLVGAVMLGRRED